MLLATSCLCHLGNEGDERAVVKHLPVAFLFYIFSVFYGKVALVSVWAIMKGGTFQGMVMITVVSVERFFAGISLQRQSIMDFVFCAFGCLLVVAGNGMAGGIEEVLHHGVLQQLQLVADDGSVFSDIVAFLPTSFLIDSFVCASE